MFEDATSSCSRCCSVSRSPSCSSGRLSLSIRGRPVELGARAPRQSYQVDNQRNGYPTLYDRPMLSLLRIGVTPNLRVASGTLNSARQVGGTLGVALMGSLLQTDHLLGLFFSFALVLVSFLVMAGITMRSMSKCGS